MERVALDELLVLESVSPRASLSLGRVAEFVTLVEEGGGDAVPPLRVVADGPTRLLFDGRHRYEALSAVGLHQVSVESIALPPGRDLEEFAYEQALLASAVSALPLTRAEKRAGAARLLATHPEYPDREIARLTGLSHQTVGRLRARSIGPDDNGEEAEPGQRYLAELTADEIASRLARSLRNLWETRGLGDLLLGDRTGKRLAAALLRIHGDDAALWAERLASWAGVAAAELRRESV